MTGALPIGRIDSALASRETENIASVAARLQPGQAGEKAKEAAEQFESVFLSQLFNMMFSGIETDGMFGGGSGEKMWRGFLVDHIADAYAERGGLGISNTVMAQIIEMSELSE